MKKKNQKKQIIRVLSESIQKIIEQERMDFSELQEIRLRIGQPVTVLYQNEELILPTMYSEKKRLGKQEMKETIEHISNYSLYAYEHELKQGFITIEGGHRVGMAGQVIMEGGKIKNMKYISSINIRVSHEVLDCANKIFPYITYNKQMYHTLIISPPRCGKTTLLRDVIRQISDGNRWIKGCTVGVVDERSELGGCYLGVIQNNLGMRTDILDRCPKADGMIMLIRSMAPQVVAVDEIGAKEDVHAIEYAMHCGCKMLATAHGDSMEEICKKPIFEKLIREKRFERYVILSNRYRLGGIEAVYDENGDLIYREA
ncbi:stage III sporulation protein AA [Tyzzerella nexilis]|nr:stage III sporulation protein AA [[Clostridium] nexile]HCX06990.1 stage III sporulation protein AA [Clostridium sp.]